MIEKEDAAVDPIQVATGGESASLQPYGQLFRMLIPSAVRVAIYDAWGELCWSSGGYETEATSVMLANWLKDAATNGSNDIKEVSGSMYLLPDANVSLFSLRDQQSDLLGVVLLECHNRGTAVQGLDALLALLRPALELLLREFQYQRRIEGLKGDLRVKDVDLALLIGDMMSNSRDAEDCDILLRIFVRQLKAICGAVLIPGKNLTIFRVSHNAHQQAASQLLAYTHKNLIPLSKTQRRTCVLNRSVNTGSPSGLMHKVLTAPIFDKERRVMGVLAFFRREMDAAFSPHEIQLIELFSLWIARIFPVGDDVLDSLVRSSALE